MSAVSSATETYVKPEWAAKIEGTRIRDSAIRFADNLPTLQPDRWERTLERFEGDEERAKIWSAGNAEYWLRKIAQLFERLKKEV
ncbi:MAG: hypothetical protein HY692_07740 [Cyanobacteria bacterium NC_groundwater_1444_Ag_S-0.65um_54_12]|nr:hypothetical protein [Cyanobacteria bacterium NC_groundwater_1444_Ag_S-0.65um_54_12]